MHSIHLEHIGVRYAQPLASGSLEPRLSVPDFVLRQNPEWKAWNRKLEFEATPLAINSVYL